MKKSSLLPVILMVLCAFSVVEIAISAGTDSPVWSPPVQIVTAPPDLADPTISYDSSGKLWVLFTTEGPGSPPQLSYITSTDLGVTWSSPQPFPPALVPEGPHYIADSCFFEDSHGKLWAAWGRWTGSSQEDIYFATSDDLGSTWSDSRLLVSYPDVDGTPCFVEVGTEVWLVFSSWGISYNWNIYCIKTSDGGSTWSSPQGIVVDSFRHDCCSAMKDATGKVWVVYSNLTSPYDPHTTDLWCTTTVDNGQTWSLPRQITSFPSEEEHPTIVEYRGVFYFDRYSTDVSYVASEDGGSTWSTIPGRISDPTIGQHYVYATVTKARIFVVWQSRMAGNMDIWMSRTISVRVLAVIDIDPNTLNLKSNGNWITCYIELPKGYNVVGINASSIMLNGTIPVDPSAPKAIGDYDRDGVPDLMVKFDRASVESLLLLKGITSGNVVLTLSGKLNDGASFEGSETIRVVAPKRMPNPT